MKKLAVIFPYKNRENHKTVMIPYITHFLKEQNCVFELFVIEGLPNVFNRGLILNAGFSIVDSLGGFDYVCLHDIDMLPIICDYSYDETGNPVHLATGCSQYNYKLPYSRYFGGVCLFTMEQFKKVNGFSNKYWIWGNEDDDLLKRCDDAGYTLTRRKCTHLCFNHERDKIYEMANKVKFRQNILDDGVKNLKYTIEKYKEQKLYHHYLIDYDVLNYFQLYDDK